MKKSWPDIKISLGICGFVFGTQILLFFLDPSFYLSSVRQSSIPHFIKWSFARYFLLTFALYFSAAWLTGIFNFLVWRWAKPESMSRRRSRVARVAMQCAQFFSVALLICYYFPSILDWMGPLDDVSVGSTFIALLLASLALSGIALTAAGPLRMRSIVSISFGILAPTLFTWGLIHPQRLNLPQAPAAADAQRSVYLLGFDALDGDSGSAALASGTGVPFGRIYTNAFTPLPSTHPSWNSILTGLYPKNHRVRFFFESPEEPIDGRQFLSKRLKEIAPYQTLFASDQPETSYFLGDHGFDHALSQRIGWEAHLRSIIFNHFIFPAVWLNNRWVENSTGNSFNSPTLFNYDLARFFNFTFGKMSDLPEGPRFLALHNCFLHSPVRLTGEELRQIPDYVSLSPKDFSYWPWPAPGQAPLSTPEGWINPYFIRRPYLMEFLPQLLSELKLKGYLKNGIAVFLSDHGERFAKGHEIYGGIHGLDIKTREQNNVMLAIFDERMHDFQKISQPASLIDIAPTIASLAGLKSEGILSDGFALLDAELKDVALPDRPLWIESMGFIQVQRNNKSFPQIAVQTLEENLNYQPNGRVTIGGEYYRMIIDNKEIADLSKEIPEPPTAKYE